MDKNARRLPPMLVDTLLGVGLFVLGLISRVEIGDSSLAEQFTRTPDAFNVVLIALESLPLVLRRRYPVTVMATTLAAFAVDRVLDYPNTLAGIGFVIAIHAVGTELPPRRSLAIGMPVVVGVVIFTTVGAVTLESVSYADIATTGLSTLIPLLLGREVNQRRLRFQALAERAERAEREREERARQAVAEERARIARELHDVVAHQMAVMTIQAEGASRVPGDLDPRVREALETIRQAGHDAMSEMRLMVGLLRTGTETTQTASLDPQPGLDRLDELVTQMRDAGLAVELVEEGSRPALSDAIDINVYRIIQESLTNALKHGGPDTRATVSLRYPPQAVEVEVSDDGLGPQAGSADGGHGLIGMRERATLLGGTLQTGHSPGGGFRVRAVIPVTAT